MRKALIALLPATALCVTALPAEAADYAVRVAKKPVRHVAVDGCNLGYACYSLYGAYGPWGGRAYWESFSFRVDRRQAGGVVSAKY